MRQRRHDAASERRATRVSARSAVAPSTPEAIRPPLELRAVIDAMPEAVLVCDPGDRVRIVNPAADRLFAGRPVQDAGDLLSRFEPVMASPVTADDPLTLRPRTIPNRWFELRTFPVGRGTAESEPPGPGGDGPAEGGKILVLRDVTATVEERAERRAFLSILSHELRTPITTIYAGSRVLARRDPSSTAASQEMARDISAEAARLYDVVEDLLVLARAEQNVLDLTEEPVLLQRVVEGAARVSKSRLGDVPILTDGATEPPAVRGDAVYIEQVVRNLVTAATRFGGPGAPVLIRLQELDSEVSLEVLDRGPDVTPDEVRTSFALADGGGVRASGLGIRLFVCRRLVEAMKGRVWVRARSGGGAAYGFTLPRYDPE